MITSKDIKEEQEKASKIIVDPKADVNSKVIALFAFNNVMLKLLVNIRTNTSLIMKHLGIELIKNPVQKENKK